MARTNTIGIKMKLLHSGICLMAFLAVWARAWTVSGQDTNAPAGGQPDAAAMAALTMPGENHKILADSVGNWTYVTTFWMSPDTNAPPLTSKGKTSTKAVMGGRYFISEHRGMMSMPGPDGKLADTEFNGMEVAGYDNVKRKFVSTWIDNFGTGIMAFQGDYDPATRTLTYTGEEEETPGMKTKVREVLTLTDHDHHKMEFFEDQGGHEFKAMEIVYIRASQ
jgi:hypothetical protein